MSTNLAPGVPAKQVSVVEHHWGGFRFASRVAYSATPQIAPVVMVGGAFQRKETWGPLAQTTLAVADVVTVDLPGWGEADTLPPSYGADFLAATLVRVLDDLGLDKVNLAGGSYGSSIAYRVAQKYPYRLRSMVLLGAMSRIPDGARERITHTLTLLRQGRMEEFATECVALMMCQDPALKVQHRTAINRILLRRFASVTPDEVAQYLANTQRLLDHKAMDAKPAPTVPTLVVTGEHDPLTTPELCRALAATCTDAWFATLADADHLSYLERSSEAADLALRFYTGQPLTGLPYLRVSERVTPRPGTPAMRQPAEELIAAG
ncbi:alpha/beta hydrolase [Longispora sp. NPDC051575]|uniref:alpha/beta fold hydrolase n=1 Tax=Longispora sp. NPDC051575 TaxID=3154943 RepID=UPI00344381BC